MRSIRDDPRHGRSSNMQKRTDEMIQNERNQTELNRLWIDRLEYKRV